MHEAERSARFHEALRWLERRECYIAAGVMKLGEPRFIDGAGTAYVAVADGRLLFAFDKRWFDGLTLDEVVGVLVYETMHVVHRHVFVTFRSLTGSDRRLYNLACDAVINDMILHHYRTMRLPGSPVTGQLLIGRSTIGMTAEQVCAILRERPRAVPSALCTLDDHGYWSGTGDVDECGQIVAPGAGVTVQDNAERPASSNADPEPAYDPTLGGTSLPDILSRLQQTIERFSATDAWGSEALGAWRDVPQEIARFDLEQRLLRRIGRKLQVETVWVPRSRRLQAFHPRVLLPTYPVQDLRRILLAVDASASIPATALGDFANIARKRIERGHVTTISFDTRAYRADLRSCLGIRGGGGTSFEAVERFACSMHPCPDVVVVLTDGRARRPRITHPERWIWCLSTAHPGRHLQGLGEWFSIQGASPPRNLTWLPAENPVAVGVRQ